MQVNLLAFMFFCLLLFGFACIDLCRMRMARSLALRPRSALVREMGRETDRFERTGGGVTSAAD
jgi:hypothetical protein